jgi:hypothetical protein
MCKLTCCRNHLFPLFLLLFCCRRHHASFHNDVGAAQRTQHNNQFGVGAAAPIAPMLTNAHRHLVRRVPIAKCLVQNPTYSYLGHNPQPTHNVRRWVVTKMADCGCHGASIPAMMHTTVAQNVGGLLYAVAPGVGHHGGCGTAATPKKVGGAWFS